MNAMWWVRYTDQNGQSGMLSLSSPDLRDPKAAHKRARETAKKRLAKKGVKAKNLTSQCVG
jgi:predicted nucleic acid-binding Zn ribbon protein